MSPVSNLESTAVLPLELLRTPSQAVDKIDVNSYNIPREEAIEKKDVSVAMAMTFDARLSRTRLGHWALPGICWLCEARPIFIPSNTTEASRVLTRWMRAAPSFIYRFTHNGRKMWTLLSKGKFETERPMTVGYRKCLMDIATPSSPKSLSRAHHGRSFEDLISHHLVTAAMLDWRRVVVSSCWGNIRFELELNQDLYGGEAALEDDLELREWWRWDEYRATSSRSSPTSKLRKRPPPSIYRNSGQYSDQFQNFASYPPFFVLLYLTFVVSQIQTSSLPLFPSSHSLPSLSLFTLLPNASITSSYSLFRIGWPFFHRHDPPPATWPWLVPPSLCSVTRRSWAAISGIWRIVYRNSGDMEISELVKTRWS